MTPPRAILFDAIETVFSLDPVRDRLTGLGAPDHALDVWFARMLRDAFALTVTGDYSLFREVAEGALRSTLADDDLDPSARATDQIFATFAELPAHDDARRAMEAVARSGVRSLILTNGTADTTTTLLERNGLSELVEGVVTVHDVGRWKPAPEPYLHAASTAGVEPADAALVAVHGWDVFGAHSAGLRTGWCSRLEHHLSPALGPADVEAESLDAVVAMLLER